MTDERRSRWRYPGSPSDPVLRRALDRALSAAPAPGGYSRGVAATLRWVLGTVAVSPWSTTPVPADPARCRAELARTRADPSAYATGVADALRWILGEPSSARLLALRQGRTLPPPE